MAEQGPFKPRVGGSSPSRLIAESKVTQRLERVEGMRHFWVKSRVEFSESGGGSIISRRDSLKLPDLALAHAMVYCLQGATGGLTGPLPRRNGPVVADNSYGV